MKKEYDFSKAERGKFYRKGAKLRLPIYLDTKVQSQLERLARKRGKDIEDLVTQIVKRELASLQDPVWLPHKGSPAFVQIENG